MVWKQLGKKFVSLVNQSPLLIYLAFIIGWYYISYQYSEPEMASGWAAANAIAAIAFLGSFTYYLKERDPRPILNIDISIQDAKVDVSSKTEE